MKTNKALIINAILLVFALPALSTEYTLLKEKSSLGFTASTWLFSTNGTFSDWNATGKTTGPNLNDLQFTITVNVTSLDTRNNERDEHLRSRDYFWVEKYPTATFESSKIVQKNQKLFHVFGDLTLRGVKKPVEFDAQLDQDKNSYRVKGTFQVNRQDYGMTTAGLPLMSIHDMVTIRFDVQGTSKD